MQIELSKKEYGDLIDVLMIADMVLSAGETSDEKRKRPFNQVIQKLYAQAAEFGYDDIVTYTESLRRFGPTHEYEKRSDVKGFLSEYERARFFDELAVRLGIRDYEEIPPQERPSSPVERMAEQEELSDTYREEFEEHGLKHLRLFRE